MAEAQQTRSCSGGREFACWRWRWIDESPSSPAVELDSFTALSYKRSSHGGNGIRYRAWPNLALSLVNFAGAVLLMGKGAPTCENVGI